VTASEAQVLVVSESVPLVIGLSLLPTDWEVVSRADVPDDLEDADVLVLDLGSTRGGLDALAALGNDGSIRAVVLGDEQPPEGLPSTTVVLLRPFTLPDLATRIDRVLHQRRRRRRRDAAPASHEPSPPAPERGTREDVAATPVVTGESRPGPPPAAPSPAAAPAAVAPRPQPTPIAGPHRLLGRFASRPDRQRDAATGDELFARRDEVRRDGDTPPFNASRSVADEPELVIDLTDRAIAEAATEDR
jgi:hypothetical protein